jgi:hypothetical protein
MTNDEKLIMLRAVCGLTEDELSDDSLSIYLDFAADVVLRRAYPFLTDFTDVFVPERYTVVQVQIANELIAKRGAEGEIMHIEDNVHRDYESAYVSQSLLNQIVPYAKVMGVDYENA